MANLRAEERWAAACVRAALDGVDVRHHDDGSRGRMHDFDLVRSGNRFGALEVTGAAVQRNIELWNLMNGKNERWIDPQLAGGWMIHLFPSARVKKIHKELPGLLASLEKSCISYLSIHDGTGGRFTARMAELGIAKVSQGSTAYPGSIYTTIELPLEQRAGIVPQHGDALADWVSEWIQHPKQSDNLEKLGRSGATQRHLFVIVPSFNPAPFAVSDLLMRDLAPLPTKPPSLPSAVTHIWIMSMWSRGIGFHWSPTSEWSRFTKVLD